MRYATLALGVVLAGALLLSLWGWYEAHARVTRYDKLVNFCVVSWGKTLEENERLRK